MNEEILEMRIDSLEDQVESLQKKLDIAVEALKELKPRLESEDDWLIVAKALREIEEVDMTGN